MFAITYIDMCENRIWLSESMLPTQSQEAARHFETVAEARATIKRYEARYGLLFRETARIVELPWTDEERESASRVADAMFASWPAREAQ